MQYEGVTHFAPPPFTGKNLKNFFNWFWVIPVFNIIKHAMANFTKFYFLFDKIIKSLMDIYPHTHIYIFFFSQENIKINDEKEIFL